MLETKTASRVQRFDENVDGRDFIVGDIHGAYDLVVQAMRQARFNPAKDRLFCVGDLVDRGPGSHRCLKFLAQPYVHAVRGNHEDMFLDLYSEGDPGETALNAICSQNGMDWWLGLDEFTRQAMLSAFRRLPLAIEVQTPRGTVGLVHAEVPIGMAWDDFLAKLEAGDPTTTQTCLWGRTRIRSRDQSGVQGVGRVFVGHTPQFDGANRFGNVYAVDTGAVFGQMDAYPEGHLTMAHLAVSTQMLVAPRAMPDTLVELKDEREYPKRPFGRYATP